MYNFINTSTIYVDAQNGLDDGTYNGYAPECDRLGNGPVKTLDCAFKLIRDLRVAGIMFPISIKLVSDIYLERPVSIVSESMDSKVDPNVGYGSVTIGSYKTRKRIVGGKKLDGWKNDVFNGVSCLSAVADDPAFDNNPFTDLYVNGMPAVLTRFPDSGTLRAVSVDESTCKENVEFFGHAKYMIVDKKDLDGLDGIEDALVNYCHCWIDEHTPVKSYDRDSGKLTFKYRSRFRITTKYDPPYSLDMHYILENIPSQFKNPGEWYFDRKGKKIYYIPRNESENAENIEVFAPCTDKFFEVVGTCEHPVTNICIKGVDFTCTRGDYASRACLNDEDREFLDNIGDEEDERFFSSDNQSVFDAHGAISFEHAANCRVDDCTFKALGLHAIEIKKGCHGIRVENSSFEYLGGGGIKIFGGAANEDESLHTYGNVIRNNRLLNMGLRYDAACGVLVCHSYENEISENEIGYLGYTGISVGWIWGYRQSNTHDNIIRKNHIHHVGIGRLSDMGGIYTLGRQSGTIVEDNIVHDVKSSHYGGWGIYPDEGSSYITIEGNTVYNTACEPFHMHYGMYNAVRNNKFYGNNGIVRISAHEGHPSAIFEDNDFIADSCPIYKSGDAKYFAPGLLADNNRVCDISGREPVMFSTSGDDYDLESWKMNFGRDYNSTIIDKSELDENPDGER